ncbi:MAG: hypothetical protein BM557_08520 [Flavobacterium sp. MedPE-SWcel]|uniref:hypothetical protein n=1 Tax=uncultured Flavobacterium sp. TaxID=165435 RepID=UPI00090FF3C8|nr:hypothetical protein [uncultured Flavobacterium sp.]OIQ17247.1 MAG: hypothetical protein BM557_08520 [Flavobacterium sp. MedPE-SWcel]
MKNLTIILFLITLCSCNHAVKKHSISQHNQPIVDYIESFINKDSVILVHERKLSIARAIKTIKVGHLFDPKEKRYNRSFIESNYYKEQAWNALNQKYYNDTIVENWGNRDFIFPYKIITHKHVMDIFNNPESYDYKNRKRVFSFSNTLYYNNNQYAMFSINIAGNIVLSESIEDVLVIMKKKKEKWVVTDKVYNDPFINP